MRLSSGHATLVFGIEVPSYQPLWYTGTQATHPFGILVHVEIIHQNYSITCLSNIVYESTWTRHGYL